MNIFSEARLLMKLRPILDREEKLMHLKLSTSTVTQMLLGVCDILNLLMPQLSGKNQVVAGAVLGCLHVIVNTLSHLSNPDGSSAKIAWVPPTKP